MLYLVIKIDDTRYALASTNVVAITPVVTLDKLAKMPDYVAGMFNYKGQPVPVVDFARLLFNRATHYKLHTRIIVCLVAEYGQKIGLLVENLHGAQKFLDKDFTQSPLNNNSAQYLGDIAVSEKGLIRRIDIQTLLHREVFDAVFNLADERQTLNV